jgi:hypothetical protein
MADENKDLVASEETIDPRLDNRTDRERPPLETFPAKPQQIDGPDLMEQPNATEAAEMVKKDADNVTRKGMSSPGPHGLGDTEAPKFDEGATPSSESAKTAADEAKSVKKKDTK